MNIDGTQMDAVFRALADSNRRRLLDRLNERNGQTLRELCSGLDMARQSVTKHLDVLEVRARQEPEVVDVEVRDAIHLENLIRALKVDTTVEAVERVRGLDSDDAGARPPGRPEPGQGILPLEHTRH